MGSLAIIALLSGLVMASFVQSGDKAKPDVPHTPDEADDIGATFSHDADTVALHLGEHETGTLAVIYVTNDESYSTHIEATEHEARFYLVPEGVDWANWTDPYDPEWIEFTTGDGAVPGAADYDGKSSHYGLAELEDHFGLKLLGTVDLLANPAALVGGITSNAPVNAYDLEANSDGNRLVVFLPKPPREALRWDDETEAAESSANDEDWPTSGIENIFRVGEESEDFLSTGGDNATLEGGAEDDDITDESVDALVHGNESHEKMEFVAETKAAGDADANSPKVTLEKGDRDLDGGNRTHITEINPANDDLAISSTGTACLVEETENTQEPDAQTDNRVISFSS